LKILLIKNIFLESFRCFIKIAEFSPNPLWSRTHTHCTALLVLLWTAVKYWTCKPKKSAPRRGAHNIWCVFGLQVQFFYSSPGSTRAVQSVWVLLQRGSWKNTHFSWKELTERIPRIYFWSSTLRHTCSYSSLGVCRQITTACLSNNACWERDS
jgi:hypothetical protein